jgi:Arrestin (or S-antigen), N-terminal domain
VRHVKYYGILDFEIRLDKNTYKAGETAKGTLLINADKSLKVKKLELSVSGKERYEAAMSGEHGHSSEKYDIFFFDDLTSHLKSTFAFSRADANNIEISQGSYSIPFHFSIPANALESYQGKHAR